MLTLKLFGPFEAAIDDVELSSLATRDGDRLLALLALQQGRVAQGTAVAQLLWPATGSQDSLRQSITYVRRVLGDEGERLQTPKGNLRLDLTNANVDLLHFDALLKAEGTEAHQEAISLYRGPLLHGWDEAWVVKERERRKTRFQEALKSVAAAHLANHAYAEAVGYLRRFVAQVPAEEWGWRALMQALVKSEERLLAVELYERYRDSLHQRYRLAPPADMTLLYREIKERRAEVTSSAKMEPGAEARKPVGGAVPLESSLYIERDADAHFRTAVARGDSIVLVKGPRQTGKTSLLARGLQQAREAGIQVVLTDFQKISASHWTSTETWYQALAQSLCDQLGLAISPTEAWSPLRGANENFERFLRREVLEKRAVPLVWGLDEVDRLFPQPFSSEVFALFRSWHNERSLDPTGPWEHLTLAIAYATEAHLFISDLNQSPFNVGTRMVLEDFTHEHAAELNSRYGSPLHEPTDLAVFYDLVGGNPYLLRRGLYEITTRFLTLEAFCAQSGQDEGCYGDHLQRMYLALSQDTELTAVVRGLLDGKPCPTPQSFYRLKSAGLITGESPQSVRFRCRLYWNYLQARLG